MRLKSWPRQSRAQGQPSGKGRLFLGRQYNWRRHGPECRVPRHGHTIQRLNADEHKQLLNLKENLHKHVVGQEEAVQAVSIAIRRSRLGLSDASRPIGAFMFLGTSGCGKTEMAKALALEVFNNPSNFHRFDMSEFHGTHTVSRLMAHSPGYLGYDEGGQLTNAIRKHPYSVLLFDEIEKCHPQVLDILLQLLDEGRITDGHGNTVDCTNCIIILTSNIGATKLLEMLTQTPEWTKAADEIKSTLMKEVRGQFRPEFLNRLDDIVFFEPLSNEMYRGVFDKLVRLINVRLEDQGIRIECSSEAVDFVLKKRQKEPVFGARPMKRYLEKSFMEQVVQFILERPKIGGIGSSVGTSTLAKRQKLSVEMGQTELTFKFVD